MPDLDADSRNKRTSSMTIPWVHRYVNPRLSGLELWHGIHEGKTLFELKNTDRFIPALFRVLEDIRQGRGLTTDLIDTKDLLKARKFDQVIFTGGETLNQNFRNFVHMHREALPFPIFVDERGHFAQADGAKRIFQEMGWNAGVAFDLGQTQLKMISEFSNLAFERDETLLPIGRSSLTRELGLKRVVDFLKLGQQRILEEHLVVPDGLLFALPLKIDADGNADTCSYPG